MTIESDKLTNNDLELSSKERLLKVAIKDFATNGYDKTSIRDLALKAKVNISAISYYFKDKEGLYQAVLGVIAKSIENHLLTTIKNANEALKNENLTPEDTKEILHEAFHKSIRFLLNEETSPSISRIFIREHIEPSNNFDEFYKNTLAPLHEAITELVAKTFNLPFPSEDAILCAHTLVGMILIFRTHREAALRRLGWKCYGEEELEKITKIIIRNLDNIAESYNKQK